MRIKKDIVGIYGKDSDLTIFGRIVVIVRAAFVVGLWWIVGSLVAKVVAR